MGGTSLCVGWLLMGIFMKVALLDIWNRTENIFEIQFICVLLVATLMHVLHYSYHFFFHVHISDISQMELIWRVQVLIFSNLAGIHFPEMFICVSSFVRICSHVRKSWITASKASQGERVHGWWVWGRVMCRRSRCVSGWRLAGDANNPVGRVTAGRLRAELLPPPPPPRSSTERIGPFLCYWPACLNPHSGISTLTRTLFQTPQVYFTAWNWHFSCIFCFILSIIIPIQMHLYSDSAELQ